MNRRHLLASVILISPVACASLTPQKAATDLDLIAAFAKAAGPTLAPLVPDPSIVTNAVNVITQADADLSGVISTATSQTTVQSIVSGVEAIAPLALSFLPGGSALVLAAQAALVLVPALLSAAGVTSPPTLAMAPTKLTPEQARVVLAGLPR